MELTLGKRISQNRKRLKLTQDQLAEQLGVTAQAVSKWENDQSCPDITILPRLAEIFGTTTDELLGYATKQAVSTAEVVDDEASDGFRVQNGNWQFRWDSGRRSALGFAILVIAVGALYMASQLLSWQLSLWDILWPTAILVFGFCGITRSFSFFRIGCVLFGGYTLADALFQFPFEPEGKLIWAILIILFGISLLADAMKKSRTPRFSFHIPSKQEKRQNYVRDGDIFTYSSSFGECTQLVVMDTLRYGDISVSFGEYILDLTKVVSVTDDCRIDAAGSFGELTMIVPKKFRVVTEHSTAFAQVDIIGAPNDTPEGQITLTGSISFGELTIEYV